MLNIDCPELREYLSSKEIIADYKKRENKLILVIGESGIGKTQCVRKILMECGYTWYMDSGANNICAEIADYMININLEDRLFGRKRCMLIDDAEILLYNNAESFLLHMKNPHHIPIILIINKLYEKKFGEFKKYSRSKLFYIHPPNPRDLLVYLRALYPQYDIAHISTVIRNYKCAIGPIIINIHTPQITAEISAKNTTKTDILNIHENINRRIPIAKYMDYMRLMADSTALQGDSEIAKFLQLAAIRLIAGDRIIIDKYTRYYTDMNSGHYFRSGILWYYYYYHIWNPQFAYDILYNMRYKILSGLRVKDISKPGKYLLLKYYKDDDYIKILKQSINNNDIENNDITHS